MIYTKKLQALLLTGCLLSLASQLLASHNTSKYSFFLERPDNYSYRKKPYLHTALFYTSASTAFHRYGGNAGLYELSGKYDLQNVFNSLKSAHKTDAALKPQLELWERQLADYASKTEFSAEGKSKARGFILQYDCDLKWNNLIVGAWVPFISINTTSRLNPSNKSLTVSDQLNLSKIRREIHDSLDLRENNWDKGGIGDIDLYLRWNYLLDHKLLMRSINLNFQIGCLAPTGISQDTSYFSSVPVMGNGHCGLYADFVPEFELKQNLKIGLMLGNIFQFRSTKVMRLPVYKEPAIFSPIVGDVSVEPGYTLKLSPYVTLENLTNGVHFQARYSYLRHNTDSWKDARSNEEKTNIPSYLNLKPDIANGLTQEAINDNIASKKNLTKWRAHYVTLQFLYNSKDALHNLVFDPNVYISYDLPIAGRGISKTHQITLGAELHF